jgi:uncharacterized membrane protein YeaQ/YmgE (transglycosylase-associated protein family)
MSWIIALVVGAVIGWLASMVMSTDNQMGWLANIVVGIIGSLLGKWVFFDVLGVGGAASAGSFSIWGIVWGVAGAIILIAILKVFRVFS